ncbi:hypothetical protein L596_001785 [Steinernema carpocapsae]|uniref:Uncharacterized protein n=1 Tax=Steinernema carpocapsae TaxID=34508 RepID=A0A4U8UPB1_STECR|nr:hypothetical protein L596_001785 [Steinernema carpocapsae]
MKRFYQHQTSTRCQKLIKIKKDIRPQRYRLRQTAMSLRSSKLAKYTDCARLAVFSIRLSDREYVAAGQLLVLLNAFLVKMQTK